MSYICRIPVSIYEPDQILQISQKKTMSEKYSEIQLKFINNIIGELTAGKISNKRKRATGEHHGEALIKRRKRY